MTQANNFKICLAAGMFGRIILTLTLSEPPFQLSVFLCNQTYRDKLFVSNMLLKNMFWPRLQFKKHISYCSTF